MKLKIATLFGIPIYLHWTFLLLIVYGMVLWWYYTITFWAAFWMGSFALSLFVCVVFHELGHALMAKKYGVATVDIILSPIGGVARLDKLPEQPVQELMVALAGPLANLLISVFLFPFYFFVDSTVKLNVWGMLSGDANTFLLVDQYGQIFIIGLFILNIVLALFNLIPAFPMDGGRMVRAILTWPFGRLKATVLASILAQIFAVFFLVYGFTNANYMLSFVGLFVFFMAQRERKLVKLEQKLKLMTIGEVIYSNKLNWTLNKPSKGSKGTSLPTLLIDKWNNPLGIIYKKKIITIQSFLSPDTSLQQALSEFGNYNYQRPIAIWDKGKIVGLLSLKEIETWLIKN